ncbi:MAG: nodulation protein NfeD, partial [Actinobacteria bacterium]|nr:nodulation protein NfeD [Actinomycetota bacterium]
MYSYKIIKYLKIFTFFLILTAVFLFFTGLSSNLFGEDISQNFIKINEFYICKIDGIIGPTLSNYISKCLNEAQKEQAALLIIIDTPGGLESSMREIALNIINTPTPVIAYVYPEGARAASAGVFIVYASDIAAMSPSTSIGAAHPVNLGSDQGVTEAQMDKIVNDSVSFIRNLASLNDRNGQWAEKAIRESASITSKEAIEINVINYIATDLDELLKKIDG